MGLEIFLFEIRYRFRQPVFYVFAALFFFMAFMAISTDSVQIMGGVGNVARNAPFVIVRTLLGIGGMAVILVTILVSSAVNRDHELRTAELFWSRPVGKAAFLGGRFFGSLAVAVLAAAAAGLGIALASFMPWQDPAFLVPFRAAAYLYALGVFVLPDLLLAGAIFFAAATLTRRPMAGYVAMIAFFVLWGVGLMAAGDLGREPAAAVLDPMGVAAFTQATKYWTVSERNTLLPPLEGLLLLNRLLWVGIGLAFLGLTLWRFRMTIGERGRRGSALHPPVRTAGAGVEAAHAAPAAIPIAVPILTPRTRAAQWLHQTRVDTRAIVGSAPFIVMLLFGVFNLAANATMERAGQPSLPVTRRMIDTISGGFEIFVLIVIVLYAGELVWKERRARIHEIMDALPVPDWIPLTAKLSALALVSFVMLVVAMTTVAVLQTAAGYTRFEPGLYARGLFAMQWTDYVLLAALALFLQVAANQRYLGFLLMVVYFLMNEHVPKWGLSHHLFFFRTTPPAPYSDMNGYGQFVSPLFWFKLHWALVATAMMLLAARLWVRGTDSTPGRRLRALRERLAGKRLLPLAAVGCGALCTGGWIVYNTNMLNEFRSPDDTKERQAAYERRYKQDEGLPSPKLTAVDLHVDIYPEKRRADVRGRLTLSNKTDKPISEIRMRVNPELTVDRIDMPGAVLAAEDREAGHRTYRLTPPLEPGAEIPLDYAARWLNRGFVNNNANTRIVGNGTFFDNFDCLPRFGYLRELELTDPQERKKHGLPRRTGMPAPDHPEARQRSAFPDADRIHFAATVSTSGGQVAVAPGYVDRAWSEGGRRFVHCEMDMPILNLYAFLSGRYEIARESFGDTAIEIYYHPAHDFNVARMIESAKKSLAYFTAQYGPYPDRQLRILEFPRYREFAQSLPNTVPYSEAAGFIADLRNRRSVDLVFFITAHEVAHQWWGHQVAPADVQGAALIAESLAQYSALMVMEKDYGRQQMRKFLAYELDHYLTGRGNDREGERPLARIEEQPYLYYNKGGLALYALREYIGEEAVNGALREFLAKHRYQGPPYPTSLDLLDCLRRATPEPYGYLIEDLFETITLYDNRVIEAAGARTPEGRYRVRIAVESRKFRADERGRETEIGHNDRIEIGVFGKEPANESAGDAPLYLEKHRLEAGRTELEVLVDQEPARAGIDPRHLLIDRVPNDNVMGVSKEARRAAPGAPEAS